MLARIGRARFAHDRRPTDASTDAPASRSGQRRTRRPRLSDTCCSLASGPRVYVGRRYSPRSRSSCRSSATPPHPGRRRSSGPADDRGSPEQRAVRSRPCDGVHPTRRQPPAIRDRLPSTMSTSEGRRPPIARAKKASSVGVGGAGAAGSLTTPATRVSDFRFRPVSATTRSGRPQLRDPCISSGRREPWRRCISRIAIAGQRSTPRSQAGLLF
jgi:hypothetical protein